MRKIVTLIFAVSFLLVCLRAESVKISIEGKKKGSIEVIKNADILYLNAKEASRIFKGSLYWQSKSGKVVLGVKRYRAVFKINSRHYSSSGRKKTLPSEVLLQNKKVFLPLEFFETKDFASAVEKDVNYDDLSDCIEINKKYDVGEMEYFSFAGTERLTFELRGVKKYSYRKKTKYNIQLLIPDATLKKPERENYEKGLIKTASVRQFGKDVLITASFSGNAKYHDVSIEKNNLIITASADTSDSKSPPAIEDTKEQDYDLPEPGEKGEIILDFSRQEKSLPQVPLLPVSKPNIPDETKASSSDKKIIVIDPGHGGKDSGGVSKGGFCEKEVNLSIAKLVADCLKKHKNIEVVLTRAKDIFVELHKRSQYANEGKADMFVSVHANSHRDSEQNGFEVFVMSENASDPWAAEVAKLENSVRQYEEDKLVTSADILLHSLARNEYINDSLLLAGIITKNVITSVPLKNRKVKKADFYVLRGTYAPSVLIETGFITNKRDRKILSGSAYRKKIADAVYKAILSFAKLKGWNTYPKTKL